ncbi:hypothetical protein ICA16_00610 [Pseudomonas anatoliensis]|uniref:hypothetical protein n=1 Tax=Pseudomonas anatoliensis TaxID=2710589 RepID=UPI001B3359EE|nr:hypothetical protein [Pseudomonas anatoliensis]MBP5954155.1 hypothetical protein [Pseudomonas anatoliensis]
MASDSKDDFLDDLVKGVMARASLAPKDRLIYDLELLIQEMHREWHDISDYVWKSASLIWHEKKLEERKIQASDTSLASVRELIEHRACIHNKRWNYTYPFMIGSGGLFSVLSIFESYLLSLAVIVDKVYGGLSTTKGSGSEKLFRYFRSLGISPDSIKYYEQIKAAQKIRNCLTHAGGDLQLAKDESELRRIVEGQIFVTPEEREGQSKCNYVLIEMYLYSDKVKVSMEYPLQLCFYLKSYLNLISEKLLSLDS